MLSQSCSRLCGAGSVSELRVAKLRLQVLLHRARACSWLHGHVQANLLPTSVVQFILPCDLHSVSKVCGAALKHTCKTAGNDLTRGAALLHALCREVLVMVMRKHQRYFPVTRPGSGDLLPAFITVANGPVHAPTVAAGNEAVLRARFEDAVFFYRCAQR